LTTIIKETISLIFRFLGVPKLIRELICRNKVTIIYYHNPKPNIFKKHIEYLSRNFVFISLNRLINAIRNKDWSKIPPKSLIITFDDGYKENYNLIEIFKKYNIYPTIYLCSHIINTNRSFWWKTGFPNSQKLKYYDNNRRLKALTYVTGYEPKLDGSKRQALNLKELSSMLRYVDFQSHSRFHPILTTCDDKECKKEIEKSKDYLGKLLNKKIEHFSYPNGDYNAREIEYLKNSGYISARTIDVGWNDVNSDPYRLKAMGIEDNASINMLSVQVCGIFRYFGYFRHKSFSGMHPPFI